MKPPESGGSGLGRPNSNASGAATSIPRTARREIIREVYLNLNPKGCQTPTPGPPGRALNRELRGLCELGSPAFETGDRGVKVGGVFLDSDKPAAVRKGGHADRTRAGERIEHDAAGRTRCQYWPRGQLQRQRAGMIGTVNTKPRQRSKQSART